MKVCLVVILYYCQWRNVLNFGLFIFGLKNHLKLAGKYCETFKENTGKKPNSGNIRMICYNEITIQSGFVFVILESYFPETQKKKKIDQELSLNIC